MNTLRVVKQSPPWTVLGVVWVWHGVMVEERFLVGMN